MTPTDPDVVRFVPSRVDGMDDVREVAFHRDHVALRVNDDWRRIEYARIAQAQVPRWFAALRRLLRRPPIPANVGERDWFKPPPERSFTLFTDPPLRICMALDELHDHDASAFGRICAVLRTGGYTTWDRG